MPRVRRASRHALHPAAPARPKAAGLRGASPDTRRARRPAPPWL